MDWGEARYWDAERGRLVEAVAVVESRYRECLNTACGVVAGRLLHQRIGRALGTHDANRAADNPTLPTPDGFSAPCLPSFLLARHQDRGDGPMSRYSMIGRRVLAPREHRAGLRPGHVVENS